MANLNKTECSCQGFYDPAGGCIPYDPAVHSEEPCPTNFWGNVGGFITSADWGAISENALNISYALGWLKPPQQNLQTQIYMQELERQRRQSMMIFVGLGIILLILVMVIVLQNRKK